jgi:hypothetical protein
MEINCGEKLSEKQAKELKVSLNYLIDNIIKCLKENPKKRGIFRLTFDNEAIFQVEVTPKGVFVEYDNKYHEKVEELSLQEALNINKYARDIEVMLSKAKESYEIAGYFTEQNPFKMICIFGEKDPMLRYQQGEGYVKVFNIKDMELEQFIGDNNEFAAGFEDSGQAAKEPDIDPSDT